MYISVAGTPFFVLKVFIKCPQSCILKELASKHQECANLSPPKRHELFVYLSRFVLTGKSKSWWTDLGKGMSHLFPAGC